MAGEESDIEVRLQKKQAVLYEHMSNWENLMLRIKNNEDMILPSAFLRRELGMDKWKNIPIPLVNATELFEKSF